MPDDKPNPPINPDPNNPNPQPKPQPQPAATNAASVAIPDQTQAER